MTGYWREDIEAGHKTGPHRTSIKAIEEYEKTYLDPFGINTYQKAGFKKLNSYYNKNKEELLATDRLTIDKYNSITLGLNLSKTGNGQNYMVYHVYSDITSKEVIYYVRYVKPIPCLFYTHLLYDFYG